MNSNFLIGTVVAYAASTQNLPGDWLPCDGSAIPSQYQDLIGAICSPNTPDLRGRTLIGTGSPSNAPQSDNTIPNFPASVHFAIKTTGGEYAHSIGTTEVPSHTHTLANGTDSEAGGGNDFATPPAATSEPVYDVPTLVTAHNTMQPYYAMNYIIFAVDLSKTHHKHN